MIDQLRSTGRIIGGYFIKFSLFLGGTILVSLRASESAIELAVIVLPLYHAFYEICVKNWSIEQAAQVSSKDFYKGTERMEFERREQEYVKIKDKLVRTALKNGEANCEDILEQLSTLRGSIFFDESYRYEYDVLWIACLMGNQKVNSKELKNKCKLVGLPDAEVTQVLKEKGDEVSVKELLRMLCAKMRN